MMINWNTKKTYEWFENAVNYTGYTDEMARLLLERIPKGGTLCDIGCGMGLIDLKLYPYFESITCMDISEESIKWLKGKTSALGISNIIPTVCDARQTEGLWDCAISLFHGQPSDFCGHYLSLVKDTLIMVTHPVPAPGYNPAKAALKKCANVDVARRAFDEANIKYDLYEGSLEYGQPLKTREEALDYVTHYKKNPENETPKEFLDRALEKTGRPDFPFYLPYKKSFGIFTIKNGS